jgi:hypothetical protein
MTTRQKTRKAPAAKPTAAEEFTAMFYDGTTASIPKLIARLRFLEADCRYGAAITAPEWPKHVAQNRHSRERAEIIQRLASAKPDCFEDAKELLDFAISLAKSSNAFDRGNSSIITILKNAAAGFYKEHLRIKMEYAVGIYEGQADA